VHRLVLHATALGLMFGAATGSARAHQPPPDVAALIEERAAYRGASALQITRILDCEGGHQWRADIVGKAGELGPAQLAPFGLLPDFYARGYSDPFDWSESVDYLAFALSKGLASHWTCSRA
jgi:hypothetical protein